jgi:hypothetical protein
LVTGHAATIRERTCFVQRSRSRVS